MVSTEVTAKANYKCMYHGAEQIMQVVSNGESYIRGGSEKMQNLSILVRKEGDNLIIVSIDGKLKFIGYESEKNFQENFKSLKYDEKVNVTGCCILPGLIDSHTHPVWEGDRINEFKMKLAGASYMEIHQMGGGIHFTVTHTKIASEETLYESLKDRLDSFTASGTTFVECKSGYGLEWDTELKIMRVLTKAKRELKTIGMSNTYLGGHAVPRLDV